MVQSIYNEYMHDEVHPFRKGYVEWWTPVIEEYLTEFLAKIATKYNNRS